jgi:hypothetical protein
MVGVIKFPCCELGLEGTCRLGGTNECGPEDQWNSYQARYAGSFTFSHAFRLLNLWFPIEPVLHDIEGLGSIQAWLWFFMYFN